MSDRKRGKGLLGLLVVAVLGVMAFTASAQALTPKFNVNGVAPAANTNVSGTQEGTGTLLVPNLNLSLTCTEFEVLEGVILAGGGVGDLRLLYKKCATFEHQSGVELPCHVSDVDTSNPSFLHVTLLKATLLPVEFADGKYGILAEGLNVQINFLSGTGCPLPLKNVIKGEICFKITAGNDTAAPLIQSNQTIQTECPEVKLEGGGAVTKDQILFGLNPGFIVGSAVLSSGTNTIGVLLL